MNNNLVIFRCFDKLTICLSVFQPKLNNIVASRPGIVVPSSDLNRVPPSFLQLLQAECPSNILGFLQYEIQDYAYKKSPNEGAYQGFNDVRLYAKSHRVFARFSTSLVCRKRGQQIRRVKTGLRRFEAGLQYFYQPFDK
jgi:hypothetical protein